MDTEIWQARTFDEQVWILWISLLVKITVTSKPKTLNKNSNLWGERETASSLDLETLWESDAILTYKYGIIFFAFGGEDLESNSQISEIFCNGSLM